MNTERTPFRPEDEDDDGSVSFGPGAAFRPVPRITRIERPAPPPQKPLTPRLSEGILLFDRSGSAAPEHVNNDAENKEDDDDENKELDAKNPKPVVSPRHVPIILRPAIEQYPAERTEAQDALALHDAVDSDNNTATAIHTAELRAPEPISAPEEVPKAVVEQTGVEQQANAEQPIQEPNVEKSEKQDAHLPDIGEFTAAVPAVPVIESAPDHDTPKAAESVTPPVTALPEWLPVGSPNVDENDPQAAVNGGGHSYAARSVLGGRSTQRNTGGSGNGSGPIPPTGNTPLSPNSPPPQPPNPNQGGGYGGVNYNANVAPTPPSTVFVHTAPPAPEYHKKRNVLPYVAVLAENIARKRADRKLKKELGSRIDEQNKLQEQANANQLRLERQQQEMLNDQRRQALIDARNSRGREWGIFSPTYGSDESTPVPSSQTSVGAGSVERAIVGAHSAPGSQAEFGYAAAPTPTQEQQMTAPGMEAIPVQPNQKIEHSAWHNVVVNEKGQEVAGALQYGEGFRRERQQEIIRDHTGDSVVAVAAGSADESVAGPAGPRGPRGHSGGNGGGAGGYGSSGGGFGYGAAPGSSYSQQLPSGMTTPGLPTGNPTHVDPQHQLPAHSTRKTSAPGPVFWVMLLAIIVAFFAATLI
ncbi:MAG: hypothetical protein ABWX94_03135 [Candidatus Saccharimonadales bacterium]